ncbi:MAG: hypothetical protein SGI87_01990 [Flavobacteriales bacterium]|nr:hypothetical protein [Flavobacteriales bacterium]
MFISFRNLLIFLLMSTAFSAIGQNETYSIEGQVKDKNTLKKLELAQVRVLQNGAEFDVYDCGGSGRFKFDLPLGYVYDITCSRSEYVQKIIRIDTKNIPLEDREGGFISQTDFFLFKNVEGFNLDILKEPVGKASFDAQKNDVVWDEDYIARQSAKIEAEFKRLEDLAKNMGKMQAEFDDLMLKGGQKMIEKKYQEAMDKFGAAKRIFPDNKDAIAKYDEAKRLFDEEQSGKELEARYKKYCDDGDKAIASKNWQQAKNQFTEALNLKPTERLPKDRLADIDKALALEANRADYDRVMADADAKFNNKDYAVCIKKYQEASKLMPAESRPRDRIAEAQAALDAMLSDEANRQKMEQRYKDLLSIGERNTKDKEYRQAITNFEEASALKPDEQLPKDKITELEKLLADMAAKQKELDALASDNSEKERIQKEFDARIKQGNTLFGASDLEKAKAEFVAALDLKPSEKYPKAKITEIDQMLADLASKKDENDTADALRRAEEERLAREQAARNDKEDQLARIEAERQERIEKERMEREAAADEKAKKDALNREKGEKFNQVDRSTEDEVEKYYRQAAESAEKSKFTAVHQQHEDYLAFRQDKEAEQDSGQSESVEAVNTQKDQLVNVYRNGQGVTLQNERRAIETKQRVEQNTLDYQTAAERTRETKVEKVEEEKSAQSRLIENDRVRLASIAETEVKKDNFSAQREMYSSKGDASRKSNIYDVDKDKKFQSDSKNEGERVREENIVEVTEIRERAATQAADVKSAADVRLEGSSREVEQQKETASSIGEGKEIIRQNKVSEIQQKKEDIEMQTISRDADASAKAFEKRSDLFSKNPGREKEASEYPMLPGTENLPQGVTETSYELPNKTVIERTVKIGNKVDQYKKVVSKYSIYYFKNDKPITENTWNSETLDIGDK